MKPNVRIRIKTIQTLDGETLDPIELETPGRLGELNHKHYLIYEESEMTGFPETTTTIKIWDKNVTVTRKGRFRMQLHYHEGERNLCMYPTPYGAISAAIATEKIAYDFGADGGELQVDYTLDTDNETFIQNSLRIAVVPL